MNHNKSQDNSPTYDLIIKIIKNNYKKQNFKVLDIASILNVSLITLQRKLKAEKQITLNQLLYQYRISQAKKMLMQQIPITIIAQNCGFSSSSHFCTRFKAQTGQTPTQFSNKEVLN